MRILLIGLALISSSLLSAQDVYTQENTEIHDAEAEKITKAYDVQLSLDANQFVLFEKKVEEFLIKRAKIEANYSGKYKLDMLYRMQARESVEMKNILTRPQLEVYDRIKNEIQPLKEIE